MALLSTLLLNKSSFLSSFSTAVRTSSKDEGELVIVFMGGGRGDEGGILLSLVTLESLVDLRGGYLLMQTHL